MAEIIFNCYIDESGTRDPYDKNTQLLSNVGIMIIKCNESMIIEKIQTLKQDFFNDSPEIKSHWLRRDEKREKYYLKPYKMSNDKLNKFVNKYYDLLTTELKNYVRVLGVVIDKEKLMKKYINPHYPTSTCYEFLLQRIANFCTQYEGIEVNIIYDDLSGKTPNGTEWKHNLIKQHKSLLKGDSPFYKNWSKRTGMDYSKISPVLNFSDSKNSEFIQIADICAYNILRQARDYWNCFDKKPFYQGYEWIHNIMHRCRYTKKITGYGAVCFP